MTQNVEKSFNSVKTTIESSKGFGSLFGWWLYKKIYI
jgi:hypothetical protein